MRAEVVRDNAFIHCRAAPVIDVDSALNAILNNEARNRYARYGDKNALARVLPIDSGIAFLLAKVSIPSTGEGNCFGEAHDFCSRSCIRPSCTLITSPLAALPTAAWIVAHGESSAAHVLESLPVGDTYQVAPASVRSWLCRASELPFTNEGEMIARRSPCAEAGEDAMPEINMLRMTRMERV